ncbi:MAG: zinc finger protein [Planctomycetota bacterium]|nr:zinc finger protein [Planctomycetota bacterium]
MPTEWTAEKVLALAPDEPSARAGRGLASATKWANLGQSDGLIWGECQGSGAKPYQTKADRETSASSCSCPSRKFPCKHALGLMLVWASAPRSLAESAPPEWVASWKEMREKKAEKSKEKAERPAAPADLAGKAKREASRAAKVASGLDDLALWLSDLVHQGFSTLAAKMEKPWDEQARRLVDAQAPGVARRLRQIDEMPLSGEGWQASLLDRLARLHLLSEGYRRCDLLPPDIAEEVRATIGFPADLDAVRAGPGVRDHWQVIGEAFVLEGSLSVHRTWLIGRETGRAGMVLGFAAGGRPHDRELTPGTVLDAEIAFFPGSLPMRGLVKERYGPPESLVHVSQGTTIARAFAIHGEALAKNPWLELSPVALRDVRLLGGEGDWSIRDASGATIPISNRSLRAWHLLAVGGGEPMTICGEFDGARLEALGAIVCGEFLPLQASETGPRETASLAAPVAVPLLVEATASAIVGVDRRPPPTPPGDDPIGANLIGLDSKEPATRLLAIAAAASLYGRVGRKPALDPNPAPDPCPPDDRPACTPEQARRLARMYQGEQDECLPEWIGLLAVSGGRLPHDAIVELLQRHEQGRFPIGPLRAILGVRGRWLAAKNPKWRILAGGDEIVEPSTTWESGAPDERMAVLRSLRASDPARARELVAATFAQEPANRRAAFVGEFARGLSMEDEPFLESTLDDRGKEVRRQAGDLLRRLPGSRLCLRMIERVRPCLTWKPGPLGIGPGPLVVELPSSCDKSAVRDGVEVKPGQGAGLGERAWWLREFVSAVPPSSIAEILDVTANRIVEATVGTEWGSVLWNAWAISTVRHGDAEWADVLLQKTHGESDPLPDSGQEHALFGVLPGSRRDAEIMRRLRADPDRLRPSQPTLEFLQALAGPVGIEAGREILSRIRPYLVEERSRFPDPAQYPRLQTWSGARSDPGYHDFHVVGAIMKLGEILPMALVDEAAEGLIDDDLSDLAYAHAFAKMIDRMRFRRDMHREFAP